MNTPLEPVDQHDTSAPGQHVSVDTGFERAYRELRSLAESWFSRGGDVGSLQPTALVHEAYIRLAEHGNTYWKNDVHFRACAAKAMRQVLIDHVRRRQARKRAGDRHRVTLHDISASEKGAREIDLIDFEDAMSELDSLNERQCRIAELRLLGGCTHAEVAGLLGLSERLVRLEWSMARAWLGWRLGEHDAT